MNDKKIKSWELLDNPPTGNKITKSLFVDCKKWVDKTYGNTYFTARIWVDNKHVLTLPFQYGYDNHFLYVANNELVKSGYLPLEFINMPLHISRDCYKFDFYYNETYVNKKNMFKIDE